MSGFGYGGGGHGHYGSSNYDDDTNDPYDPQNHQQQQYDAYGGGYQTSQSRSRYPSYSNPNEYDPADAMGYNNNDGLYGRDDDGLLEGSSSVGDDLVDDDLSVGEEGEDEEEDDDESPVDFDDPEIAKLPRILLMGPRRAGKTSIQRVVFHKMSPHETLFRLEATQSLERSVVDHTPLCRFTICDFPGDYYGPEITNNNNNMPNNANAPDQTNTWGMTDPITGSSDHLPSHLHSQQQQQQSPYNDPSYPHHHHQQQQQHHTNNLDGLPNVIGGSTSTSSTTPTPHSADSQIFGRATALIFVLDAQDEPYDHVLQHFTETVKRASRANPHIAIEVFINKVDGELFLSDEAKYDCRRDVMQQVTDELSDAGVMPDSVPISYHLTSIYDHSVFEAFSRVVQKLIPQLPTLENLLNVLVSTCSMEKAYLFDVATKLYVSTDSSPVDMQSVELCSDMIDVVLDVSGIYGLPALANSNEEEEEVEAIGGGEGGFDGPNYITDGNAVFPNATRGESLTSVNSGDINANNGKLGGNTTDEMDGSQVISSGGGVGGVDAQSQFTGESSALEYRNGGDELVGTLISQEAGAIGEIQDEEQELDADSAYDGESSSVIRLSNGMILYLKEVDTMLALVCLTRTENFRKKGLINYNIGCLKKALKSLVPPSESD